MGNNTPPHFITVRVNSAVPLALLETLTVPHVSFVMVNVPKPALQPLRIVVTPLTFELHAPITSMLLGPDIINNPFVTPMFLTS